MCNLAIIIGVSEYDTQEDLPACKNDSKIIYDILSESEKFDDILQIDGYVSGRNIKSKISEFVRNNENKKVEEIFFYFSGHGTRIDEDFWYVLSDFDGNSIHTTALSNDELDEILKSLNPQLTVKVVDACSAGTEYIKSSYNISNIFEKSLQEKKFNKIYFLFSSTRNQPSIAFKDISLFTKSFVSAIFSFDKSSIRYQDLVNYITDDLSSSKVNQNPYFVTQANQTEIFIDVSNIDIDRLKIKFPYFLEENIDTSATNSRESKLVDKVKEANKYYCSKDEAIKILIDLESTIENFKFSEDLVELFNIEILNSNDLSEIPDKKKIAKWLSDADEEYFTRLIYTKIEKERFLNAISHITGTGAKETYNEEVISSYELTCLDYNSVVVITLLPKFEFLVRYDLFITFVISKNKITAFSKFERYKNLNWDNDKLMSENPWSVNTKFLKPAKELFTSFEEILMKLDSEIVYDVENLVN